VHADCTPETCSCLPVLARSFRKVLILRTGENAKTRINAGLDGAVGENRTHDLSLTKGLRYHYATTATVVFPDLSPESLSQSSAKGALL
jgi:hypothetical protein